MHPIIMTVLGFIFLVGVGTMVSPVIGFGIAFIGLFAIDMSC